MSEIFYGQIGPIEYVRSQDGCHHQVKWEWMSLSQIKLVRVRVLGKMAKSKIDRIQDSCQHQDESEWISEVFFVQKGLIQDDRIQDGCHHQIESEWMSFSQIELVRVRVLCKMAKSKMTEFRMAEFKMASIIKLSQNEWVWIRLN